MGPKLKKPFEYSEEDDDPTEEDRSALHHMTPIDNSAATGSGGDPHRAFHSIKALTNSFDSLSIDSEHLLRTLISEIVRKCGNKWCLYTKKKTKGKRRRLGTHSTKADAYKQEYAIKAHGG